MTIGVALAVIVAFGDAVLRAVSPRMRLWWFERLSFSFVLGFGAAFLCWMVFTPAYSLVEPWWLVGTIAVAAWIVMSRRRVRPSRPNERPSSSSLLWTAAGCLLAIQCAALLVTSLHTPLGWDGLFNFELKARLAFEQQPRGQIPIAYFADASRTWSHPRYPLLVPFAEFWVYSWLGRVDQTAVKLLFPLFFFSIVGTICGVVRRLTNARAALATGIGLGFVPALTMGPGAVTGYADVPLAAATVAALSCAVYGFERHENRPLVLAAVFSAIGAWTKVEGLIIALYLGVGVIVLAARRLRRGTPEPGPSMVAASSVLWLPFLAAVPWLWFQHHYGMAETDFPSFSPAIAVGNIDRIGFIVQYAVRELLRPGRWGLIWPAFAVAFGFSLLRRKLHDIDLLIAGAVLVPLTCYLCVYLFSSWVNWQEHVGTSFERLLTPLAPLALAFAVYRSWDSLRIARAESEPAS